MGLVLIVVLGALSGLGPLSIDMYLPAFPALVDDFGVGPATVQATLTAYTVGLAVGQLLAGPLSDSLGRRRPLLVGLIVFALAGAGAAVAPTIEAVIVLRLVQGLGAAAGIVIARAIVRDVCSGAAMNRLFSLLLLVNGLAPIIGPVVGGQILRVTTWRGTFVALSATGLVLLVLIVVTFSETLPPDRRIRGGPRATVAAFRILLTDVRFVGLALTSALPFASLFAYIAGSTFVLQQVFGLSPQQFALVFGLNSLGTLIAGGVNSLMARWMSTETLLLASLSLLAAGGVGVLVAAIAGGGLTTVVVSLFLVTSSIGVVFPAATTLALDTQRERAGSASAFLGTLQFLIGGAAAPLVGSVGVTSALPMGLVIAASAVLSLAVGVVTILAVHRRDSRPS